MEAYCLGRENALFVLNSVNANLEQDSNYKLMLAQNSHDNLEHYKKKGWTNLIPGAQEKNRAAEKSFEEAEELLIHNCMMLDFANQQVK